MILVALNLSVFRPFLLPFGIFGVWHSNISVERTPTHTQVDAPSTFCWKSPASTTLLRMILVCMHFLLSMLSVCRLRNAVCRWSAITLLSGHIDVVRTKWHSETDINEKTMTMSEWVSRENANPPVKPRRQYQFYVLTDDVLSTASEHWFVACICLGRAVSSYIRLPPFLFQWLLSGTVFRDILQKWISQSLF